MIEVFIFCDDRLLGAGLCALLRGEDDFDVVGESPDGKAGVLRVKELRPDVVITTAPALSRDSYRELVTLSKLVIFADVEAPQHAAEILALRPRAVLSRKVSATGLVQAVRMVASDDAVVLSLAMQRQLERMAQQVVVDAPANSIAELTSREADVLRLLAQGLSNQDVAKALFVSAATVRSHVHRILHKLQVRNRTQAVALAYPGLWKRQACDCELNRESSNSR